MIRGTRSWKGKSLGRGQMNTERMTMLFLSANAVGANLMRQLRMPRGCLELAMDVLALRECHVV